MNVSVAPVRLVFNVDSINAVAVSSNWLYMTGGPSTVVRINLDSPSHVEDIQLPKKHVSTAGFIKYLFTDATGQSLLAVTSRCEHFFYAGAKHEFKHLGKLRGTTTVCASFYNRHSFLMGTKAGNIVEVGIDSSANETYFKRDLRLAAQIWKSPRKDPVTSIIISGHEVTASCGSDVIRWSDYASNGVSTASASLGEPIFQRLLLKDPEILLTNPDKHGIRQLVRSPDGKNLAATLGPNKVAFSRLGGDWQEVEITSSLEYLLVSNYYLLAIVSQGQDNYSVLTVNLFSQQLLQYTPIPESRAIRGVTADLHQGTFWLYSHDSLLEIKMNNEEAGMWKVLTEQARFEEALEVASSHGAKSYVLDKYGHHILPETPAKGAELLGLSDAPLEVAALDVLRYDSKAVIELLMARLSHTKSKAQQIMLTSWLAELGDYTFLNSSVAWDSSTILQILKEQGDFKTYLSVLINTGNIDGAVSHYVANENWPEALDLLRQHESAESVYKYSSILLNRAPRPTVESWMRMSSLDVNRLIPSLIKYSNEYRGPTKDNQALRYLKHLLKQDADVSANIAVFNATVSMLSTHGEDEDTLSFLKSYAPDFGDHFFALRMCLKNNQHRSAVFLYTLAGLYEDAVQICLDIGTKEMYELAVDIASNQTTAVSQGNEELRKYLLRTIAHQAIKTQGTSAAIRFIKLLRVDDLLAQFPDFDTLSDLAPEIVRSLEHTNSRLNTLNQEIDETLHASEDMQKELSQFKRRSVLVEPGEPCYICDFPLVTRKFVVFPCQHGFHMDCVQQRLYATRVKKDVTDECVLCSKENLRQIEAPLDAEF